MTENERFDQELRDAGIPHQFDLYQGGHNTALWRAHAAAWLRLALRAIAARR